MNDVQDVQPEHGTSALSPITEDAEKTPGDANNSRSSDRPQQAIVVFGSSQARGAFTAGCPSNPC